jgi:hypothetical protein
MILQINLMFGANSSVVERFFSVKADVLTKKRKRMHHKTLETLCLIAHNGPNFEKFSANDAVRHQKKKKTVV